MSNTTGKKAPEPASERNGAASEARVDSAGSRRRFLRTSAIAAPAVFTLPSSAAAINFGSFAQCVRNTEIQPGYLHTAAEDNWARQPVPAVHVVPKSMAEQFPPDPTQVQILVRYGTPEVYVDANNQPWQRLFTGEYQGPYSAEPYVETQQTSQRYTVAFVTDEGEIVGTHPKFVNEEGVHAVTGSCWISLLPRP